jgi:hypothetical protein
MAFLINELKSFETPITLRFKDREKFLGNKSLMGLIPPKGGDIND